MRQTYDRPTTWIMTIYTRSTFSLTKLNMQKFPPGFSERKLSGALKKLSKEMFFAFFRSVLFKKRLHVNQSTTSSHAIFPYISRNLSKHTSFSIDFGYECRSVWKRVLNSYEFFLTHTTVVSKLDVWFTYLACRELVAYGIVVSCKSVRSY